MGDSPEKSVFLETFGCQMNVLDSQLVEGQLRGLGYKFTEDKTDADVILFNTCSVRQAAEDKVYARVGDCKNIKKQNPDTVLGVIGCMAERDGADILKKYPQIDLLCGPGELDKIPLLIDNVFKTKSAQTSLQGHNSRRSSTLAAASDNLELLDLSRSISASDHNGSAYVRITRGCNKFCTYCVVPFTRGAEIHRPPDHILEECKRLADAGIVEITLLGQTVNHYRYDHGASITLNGIEQPQVGPGGAAFKDQSHKLNQSRKITTFADLLKLIHDEVPAIKRLRFVTSFPRDFGDDILQVIAESPRLCDYLHIPVQSGSNRILKLMNRDYTVEEYLELIHRVRHFLPNAAIASDFIVGFPTETDEDFAASAKLLETCKYKNSFIFKYSPRPGTLAIDKFPDDVPEEVKKQRNVALLATQAKVSQQVHNNQIGQTLDVLVEGVSHYTKREQNNIELRWEKPQHAVQLTGRTTTDLIVMFDGPPSLIGEIVPVKIQNAKPLTLFGQLAQQTAAI